LVASLREGGVPTLEGPWCYLGPFDNAGNRGFATAYPPEKEIDLKKTYPVEGGETAGWKEFTDFRVGKVNDLRRFKKSDHLCVYLSHEVDAPEALDLPVTLGSDDGLAVWLNGEKVLSRDVVRGAAPDQDQATLKLKAGKNQLLVKVCNEAGEWAFYV